MQRKLNVETSHRHSSTSLPPLRTTSTAASTPTATRFRRRIGRAPLLLLLLLALALTLPVREASAQPQGPPQVATGRYLIDTSSTVTFFGTLLSGGQLGLATVWFDWGTSTNYGNSISAGGAMVGMDFHATAGGFTSGVTYYYRAGASDEYGTAYGGGGSFIFIPPGAGPPSVTTQAATDVSANSATLNGAVNSVGLPTTAWFQWGATTSYGNLTSATDIGSGNISAQLAGLTPGATYHFQAVARNVLAVVWGSDQSFTTGPPEAQVSTLPATGISTNSATLNGTVNPNGWPTTAWFEWGATTNYGNLTSQTNLGSETTTLPLSAALAGLTPNGNYHFRVVATNDYGLAYGSDQSFTTRAWTLNGGATMAGNTIALTVGAGSTSRSAFLNNQQDISAFNIVFFYQDVSGAGGADGVTFCIQNQAATALGGAGGGLGYAGITPSVALAMNIWAPNGRGVALFQNGTVTYGYASLLPNVDIGGNTNVIQVNVTYSASILQATFKDTVTGLYVTTTYTVNIPSIVGGSTAWVGFTGGDGGAASTQVISWGGSTPTILIPPRTQTAEAGSTVGLSVHASSALPLSFLWYLNDTNLISWSTNSDLELTNVQISNSGAYTVVLTNVAGAVISAPAMLNVITPVERRPVPGVKLMGQPGTSWDVVYADSLGQAPNWTMLGSVGLSSTPQYCFDLTQPLPPQRFYRAWQTTDPLALPVLDLRMVPAITLTGSIGSSVRVDAINRFGPIDAWFTLATVTLTNTSQLYFDVSAPGQPERLYRLVPSP